MRRTLFTAAALLATVPALSAQLPAGWSARLDSDRMSLDNVEFRTMGTGLHLTTGPHVILWREADRTAGRFHTEATITRTKAPAHAESYGLIFAGRDLNGAAQTYLYFLVRGDGKFLIRKREGTAVSNVAGAWADHEAINKADEAGKVTDKLEVLSNGSVVRFSVNGKVVHEMPAAGLNLEGHVGLRASHALDLHIEGFVVHRM